MTLQNTDRETFYKCKQCDTMYEMKLSFCTNCYAFNDTFIEYFE